MTTPSKESRERMRAAKQHAHGVDRERLADLYRSGMPLADIATELGTTRGYVVGRLHRLRSYGYDLPYRYSAERVAAMRAKRWGSWQRSPFGAVEVDYDKP